MNPASSRILHAGLFAGAILGLAALAGSRVSDISLPVEAELLDGTAARALENQYEAGFPIKTFGINVWAAIEYGLFREGRPGLVIGEQDWLYTDEEFKAAADADVQLERHLLMISRVSEQLAARGTAVLLAAVPSKARIYAEHLGRRKPAAAHGPLYERLRRAAAGAGMPAPDLATALSMCKRHDQIFLRTDTHWTPAGARCAARSLVSSLRQPGLATAAPLRFRTERAAPADHSGDLLRYLPLAPYMTALLPPADRLAIETTAATTAESDLLGDSIAPQVVLVGTSYSADSRWNFAGALTQLLGQDVVSYASAGQGPFIPMQEYLRSEDFRRSAPRLLVWEIPERYLLLGDRPATGIQPAAAQTSVRARGFNHDLLEPLEKFA